MERDQYVVWITTRKIKPGTYEDFRRAWRPRSSRRDAARVRVLLGGAERGGRISTWDSFESRERYRLSDVEAARQQAMAPFVEAESSGLYTGRELQIPKED